MDWAIDETTSLVVGGAGAGGAGAGAATGAGGGRCVRLQPVVSSRVASSTNSDATGHPAGQVIEAGGVDVWRVVTAGTLPENTGPASVMRPIFWSVSRCRGMLPARL